MSNFSSACSAHLKATLRACARPRVWSRWIWMSAMGSLLIVMRVVDGGAKRLAAFVLGQPCQPFDGIIKPLPVPAFAFKKCLEAGHQLIVGGLRAESRVVGARH